MHDEQFPCRTPDAGDVISSESLERIVAYLEVQIEELDRRERLLNSELACLDSERRTLRMQMRQFEERVEEQDADLKQREQVVSVAESANDQLGRQLQEELERLARDRGQVESVQEGLRQEQTSWRERFEEEMAERRREIEEQDRQISRRMVDLEKRARFHEEHLEKLRRELDRQKRELDAAVQRQRLEREQAWDQARRRRAQIEAYRETAERRDRETRAAYRVLQAQERTLARDTAELLELLARERGRLHDASLAWSCEQEEQAGRLRARELALEEREARLDSAREELQAAQRQCTQSRAAAERAWSELCEAVGAEEAGSRLETQRSWLDEQLQAWERADSDRTDELRRAIDELRRERAAAAEFSAAQSERLARREEALRELAAAVGRMLARLAERLRTVAAPLNDARHDSVETPDELDGAIRANRPHDRTGIESDAA